LQKYKNIVMNLILKAVFAIFVFGLAALGKTAVHSLIDNTEFFLHKITWFCKDIFTI